VELGEGIIGTCHISDQAPAAEEKAATAKADLSSLSSMLQNRWKGGESSAKSKPEAIQSGQVRSFRITKLDREAKKIELELAT
jgi:small subunit ribosomal protein S1